MYIAAYFSKMAHRGAKRDTRISEEQSKPMDCTISWCSRTASTMVVAGQKFPNRALSTELALAKLVVDFSAQCTHQLNRPQRPVAKGFRPHHWFLLSNSGYWPPVRDTCGRGAATSLWPFAPHLFPLTLPFS